ncbi:transmembrane protein 11-A, mitochondrial [Lingula anatina]|uniref:Transmembrane protein 11-A, mitochondrial n=1 Tax=Lingula anatina TaxID=7574 RepID=A0A1S3JHX2_LINAN|nr:transmembrane protein 11-A, mitochondrial-like [Lingula anatina]XP_013410015.1 transmembrane protein 11-A, mitochondrial [Lingula anatina]|eukprot:XP_013384776.1 transmembrane protein 11-A, mitochondrial-like [Lingula anatina]
MAGRVGEMNPNDFRIIREIYENDSAPEDFENELDRALEDCVSFIIIEPTKLGDETARWIKVGNCLHKTSLLSGVCCLAVGKLWPQVGSILTCPLGVVSVMCAGLYMASWQYDPCCKYQVVTDPRKLQGLPLYDLTSPSYVALERKDDTARKILHTIVALAAGGFCLWKLSKWYSSYSYVDEIDL